MSKTAYARHAGVNVRTIQRWVRNGRISQEDDGTIDPARADSERIATESPLPHHQARKAQIDAEKAQAARGTALSGPGLGPAEIGAALKLETYKLQKARAEAANLDLDRSAGLLLERAAVAASLADFGATLRSMAENLPHRLAPALAEHRGDAAAIHAELESAMADLLAELAGHLERKLGTAL